MLTTYTTGLLLLAVRLHRSFGAILAKCHFGWWSSRNALAATFHLLVGNAEQPTHAKPLT